MIRFFLVILLVHFGLSTLTACTSSSTEDETSDEAGPIEDDGDSAVADDDTEESADEEGDTTEETASEDGTKTNETAEASDDDLESEFDKETGDKAQNEAPVEDDLQKDELEETPAETPPPPPVVSEDMPEPEPEPVAPPPPVEEKARIRDIRYLSNSSGGTVVIETSKPVTYQTRMNAATNQFVIEVADAELPPALQKPVELRNQGSRIGGINAYQGSGSHTARIVIQLTGQSGGEPIVQQEGTSLVVIPPAPVPVAIVEPERTKPVQPVQPQTETALSAKTLDEFLTGNQKFFGRVISLQVKDADVRDIVNFLAEESGANIVMSDDVEGKISLKLRRVPWDQALVTIMRTKSLGYVRQGNVLRISTLKSLQAETEAANKILEAQKAIVPNVVQVVPVSYADLDDLTKNVTPFLSKDGKVQGDKRTSTIIVTDRQEVVDRIGKLIKTLDVAPAQVSIESKIVEAVEDFERFVGINWGFSGSPTTLSAAGGASGAPIDLGFGMSSFSVAPDVSAGAPFSGTLSLGTLDMFGNLDATLTMAENDSMAKVISAPRISTMNREKATIKQEGENVTISTTVTPTSTQTSEKRTPFALELNVTPQITADGGVIMDLDVRREFLGPLLDQATGARAVNKRSAKSKILVRNGQTAVIGGIYTNDELEANKGVPGLKDLPILGWLFKSKSHTRSKNELLIFMTPRIISEGVSGSNEMASTGSGNQDSLIK
jgi:type IV pilus assembly protein PilQ